MNHDMVLYLIALIAGTLSAISGGSGTIMLPSLLAFGVPVQIALGTNKLYTTANLFASFVQYYRAGQMVLKPWWISIALTMFGSIIGVLLTGHLPSRVLENLLLVVIVYLSLKKYLPKKINIHLHYSMTHQSYLFYSLSLIIGVYSGLVGAGSGLIWNFVGESLEGITGCAILAFSRLLSFSANIIALVVFIVLGKIDYKLGIGLVACGTTGAMIGAKLTLKHGEKMIRFIILITTLLVCGKIIYDNLITYPFIHAIQSKAITWCHLI